MTAQIIIDNKNYQCPIITGTEQETAIDISTLRSRSKIITMDNGFGNTATTTSEITYVDGEQGILHYRGYDIAELCKKSNFIEVSYLLIYGELPTASQLSYFDNNIREHSMIMEDIKRYFDVWPRTAHPMALLSSVISGMSTFYEDSLDIYDDRQIEISIHRLLAKCPTIAAYAFKKSVGQPKIYPLNRLNYAENFMRMMFAVPTAEYEIDADIVKVLDQLLIIHADHEQNCSTSAVRLVGSSHANMFASVAAGVLALWGPLHGGANQAVLETLEQIHNSEYDLKHWINKAKDKNNHFRLSGFGHRVYKNFDPRATILKDACKVVFNKLGVNDPLLDIALELEEIVLKDDYFIEKKLYPNVDFYSGIIYKALGFPIKMFPVLFALGRMPGWIAHWKEMIKNSHTRIGRPRQIYNGYTLRQYMDLEKRV
jgi:citrate synthase